MKKNILIVLGIALVLGLGFRFLNPANDGGSYVASPEVSDTATQTSPNTTPTPTPNTNPVSNPVPETPTTKPVAGVYTMADVSTHASTASCWTVVNNTVYDVTKWILRHPGGTRAIAGMCGKDATAAFTGQHGG